MGHREAQLPLVTQQECSRQDWNPEHQAAASVLLTTHCSALVSRSQPRTASQVMLRSPWRSHRHGETLMIETGEPAAQADPGGPVEDGL